MRTLRKLGIGVQRLIIRAKAHRDVHQSDILLRHVSRYGIESVETDLVSSEEEWERHKRRSERFDVEKALDKRGFCDSNADNYGAEYLKELQHQRALQRQPAACRGAERACPEHEDEMEAGQ